VTEAIGGFTIQDDGTLLFFMAKGAVKLWENGVICGTVISEIQRELDSRFNDVIADPEGRVFCGTLSSKSHTGRLYRLDTDGSIQVVLENIGISNGLGFTPALDKLYYTDSRKRTIYLFDYDRASGHISHKRVFVKVPDREGIPDGLTVDQEGCVWSAQWGGACVVRYSPKGKEIERISFPANKISSVTFGGINYNDLYFTSAGGLDRAKEGKFAGALFHMRTNVTGVPEFRSKITACHTKVTS
jgi:D-xylonolactonase